MGLVSDVKMLVKHRKALSQAAKLAKTVSKARSRWKSPEFWATVCLDVGALVGALTGVVPATMAAVSMTVINSGYFIARSVRKSQSEADTNLWRSSEFYLGLFDIVSKGILEMQTAGISAQWLISLNGVMGGVMTYFTRIADNDPTDPRVKDITVDKEG